MNEIQDTDEEIWEKRKEKSGIKIRAKAYQTWDNSDGDGEKINKNRKEWICMKWVYVHMQLMVFRQSKYNTVHWATQQGLHHQKTSVSVLKFTFIIWLFLSFKTLWFSDISKLNTRSNVLNGTMNTMLLWKSANKSLHLDSVRAF